MDKLAISELINRRRHQILIHSCLYYRLNTNIISDHTYDKWSKELAQLQADCPDIASQCAYHEYYKDFDGSSGYDLPYHLIDVESRAMNLLIVNERYKQM